MGSRYIYKALKTILHFMEAYLKENYPPVILGQEIIPDLYDVKPETLTVDQKRAIGDFILFVGRSARYFLVDDITILIRRKLEKYLAPSPDDEQTLYKTAFEALFNNSFKRIEDIWLKYWGEADLRELQSELSRTEDIERRLREALKKLSKHVMEYAYNHNNHSTHENMTLMQDFIDLINWLKLIFKIEFSERSENILRFFSCLASNGNIRKISTFFDAEDRSVSRRRNADEVSETDLSPWSVERPPVNREQRKVYDSREWEAVNQILDCCIHLPLSGVIILALHNVSRHYQPRRLRRRRGDSAPDQTELLQEQSSGEVFNTLCFHPLFIEFWCKLQNIHAKEVLRAQIVWLIDMNPSDVQLQEHFTELLNLFFDAE